MGSTVGPISQAVVGIVNTPSALSSQKQNIDPVRGSLVEVLRTRDFVASETSNGIEETRQIKADAIDAYFKKYNMPLEGTGMKMVLEAEKNELDWRLLPAITVRESSGGKFACKTVGYNAFGWGSCKFGFSSNEEAIERIAFHLGGNHPKTEKYYNNKTTIGILHSYNPPSIVPRYAEQVISIMNSIGDEDVVTENSSLVLAK